MISKPKIAVIIGSTRASRFGAKPAQWIADRAQKKGWQVDILDLRDFDLPFFDEVASNRYAPSKDPRAVAWQTKLAEYDGFIFVTPEYNRSIPASLKNALDHANVEWTHKPAAVFGYGGTGAARAVEHLRSIVIELRMVPVQAAAHIVGADFMAVSPMGAGREIAEIEDHIGPGADAMLDELDWWLDATMDARAAERAKAA